MSVEEICSVICLFSLVLGLLGLLFFSILLTYKNEKEYRTLRNQELKARIKFFNRYTKDNNIE